MADANLGSCTRTSCPLATTGLCEHGHTDLSDCENFVAMPTSDSSQDDNTLPEPRTPVADAGLAVTAAQLQSRLFSDGKALDVEGANQVTADAQTQVIVLAGEIECGKTTLLATIYEKFQAGPFAGYDFGGSQTLVAFEQKCFLARIASEQLSSDTERTKVLDPEHLHLMVKKRNGKGASSTNLLFTDVSGELFRMIKDSSEECKKMAVLTRADHIAILLDGAQLADKKFRQKALQDCKGLLRSILEGGMIGKDTFVEIIYSKWDLIQPKKTRTEHTDFVDASTDALKREFQTAVRKLQFFPIASRAQNEVKYPLGYKISGLFRSWAHDNYLASSEIPVDES